MKMKRMRGHSAIAILLWLLSLGAISTAAFVTYAEWRPFPTQHHGSGKIFQAPEIDAKSGTSAIALLIGVLFLASERKGVKLKKD